MKRFILSSLIVRTLSLKPQRGNDDQRQGGNDATAKETDATAIVGNDSTATTTIVADTTPADEAQQALLVKIAEASIKVYSNVHDSSDVARCMNGFYWDKLASKVYAFVRGVELSPAQSQYIRRQLLALYGGNPKVATDLVKFGTAFHSADDAANKAECNRCVAYILRYGDDVIADPRLEVALQAKGKAKEWVKW